MGSESNTTEMTKDLDYIRIYYILSSTGERAIDAYPDSQRVKVDLGPTGNCGPGCLSS